MSVFCFERRFRTMNTSNGNSTLFIGINRYNIVENIEDQILITLNESVTGELSSQDILEKIKDANLRQVRQQCATV